MTGHTATAEVDVSAAPAQVWQALTDPSQIKRYMYGAEVDATWEPGSPITWKGEYDGRGYQDKGEVIEAEPGRRLVVTHFSPLSGQEDKPENCHRLTYDLEPAGDRTHLRLEQDNAGSAEEAEHSRQNWQTMLDNLKNLVERG
ncbi:SRPBCC domain-containing protein [Nocardioides speluncae]|uniref:SRPBCC domain-containing protein n=1 Tax=Nocardioides speluncae TaxID=2670337 RepID=UPI000D69904E|nr:SRPBCC domain-containing protein [Nocardioides speluncae]